jgi:hypothetical protein
MKTTRGITHRIATCFTCGKEWQNYKTARQLAYNHAKKTGHKVTIETGYFITYN